MSTSVSSKCLIISAATGLLACTHLNPSDVTAETGLTRELRRAFEDSARASGIIGAQLAVSIPGQPLWTAEYGIDRPDVPMTADRLLGTGSISKMFAAVAALRLVDRGAISLNDSLGRWFPDFTNVSPSIRLRDVLQHRSGLPEYAASPDWAPAVSADRNRVWAHEELIRFIGPPTFAPGTAWRASNSDRLLLSLIAARESRTTYGVHLRRELFRDGRGENWTPGDGQAPRPLGVHWVTEGGQRVNFSERSFTPSLFTTRRETYISARDLAVFVRRLFDGDLLSASGRALLTTIVEDDHRIPGQTGGGVGIRRFEYFERTMYGNSGATTNSSALYLYDAATRVIVVLSTNQSGESHGNSHFRIVPALMRLAAGFPVETSRGAELRP